MTYQMDGSYMASFYKGYGMSQFADNIWIGGCACAMDYAGLKERGITATLNLTPDDFGNAAAGFKTFQIAVDDAEEIMDHDIAQFIDKMAEWVDAGEVVYVSCHAGISRTPSFLIAWLMYKRGCNKESDLRGEWSVAEDKIKLARPIILPHFLLKRSVLRYFGNID